MLRLLNCAAPLTEVQRSVLSLASSFVLVNVTFFINVDGEALGVPQLASRAESHLLARASGQVSVKRRWLLFVAFSNSGGRWLWSD